MNNRIEHQKPQFGFVFSVQQGIREIQALTKTEQTRNIMCFLWVSDSTYVYQGPGRVPSEKLKGHFAMAIWFNFWCLTGLPLSDKKCLM